MFEPKTAVDPAGCATDGCGGEMHQIALHGFSGIPQKRPPVPTDTSDPEVGSLCYSWGMSFLD